MRILIVDDERSVREFADRALRGAGYATTLASDGPEALDLAKADSFDLLLADVMMPQMRGEELALRCEKPSRISRCST